MTVRFFMPSALARIAALPILFALLPVTVATARDAEPVLIAITAQQASAVGVATAPLSGEGAPASGNLPAIVVVPNTQLHVVSAPLAGMVEHIAVATDQTVKRGQVLARLQSPALAEVQRGYLQASAQNQLAQENLARDTQLLKEGIIPEARFRATRAQALESAAGLGERRQALRAAGLGDAALRRMQGGQAVGGAVEITAPADGIVLEQMTTTGQRVESAAPLFRVGQLDKLWLEIQVPASQASGLAPGAAVTVPRFDATGKVLSVGRQVSAGQTVLVRALVASGAQRLSPGQSVEVRIGTPPAAKGAAPSGNWRVPTVALVRHEGRVLVFVADKDGFRAQPVTLVNEGGEASLVSAPFNGSERIAVRGTAALKARLAGVGVP